MATDGAASAGPRCASVTPVPQDSWVYLVVAAVIAVAVIGLLVILGLRNDRRAALGRHARRRPARSAFRQTGPDAEAPPRKRAAVVVNPMKVPDVTRWRAEVTAAFTGHDWELPLILETRVDDPGAGQAREALSTGVDLVCVLGGDGTVRQVAQELVGTSTPLGLLPGGTGNLLARNLLVPMDSLASAVEVAVSGRNRHVDVGWVTLDPDTERTSRNAFIVMAGMGFDAEIMENTSEELKAMVGWPAYISGGLRGLIGGRFKMTVTVDGGEPRVYRTRTIVAGNCGRITGGINLMPDAEIDDGELDLVVLSPKGLASWARVAAHVITRSGSTTSRLDRFRATSAEVVVEEPQSVQADGDVLGEATRLRFEIAPRSLIVRTPGIGRTAIGSA